MQRDIPVDVDRRATLRKLGGGLAAATGGAVVAFGSTGTANASIAADSIGIPPATHSGKDGTVSAIELSVSGSWQYTVSAADEILVTLEVASDPTKSDWGVLDQHKENALAASGAGPYSLSGDILSHDQLEASSFSADPGKTVTKDVGVRVVLDVLKGGQPVTTATARGTATIEVSSTAVAVSSEITASGSVEVAV